MKKTFLALLMVVTTATGVVAQEFYVEAVNINYSDGSTGNVTGPQATPQTPDGALSGNWNNIVDTGPSAYGGAVNSDGYGGIWAATPITSSEALLTNLQIQVNNGGWGNMYIADGVGAAGTLGYSVVYNASPASQWGDPAHWNWYLTWQGLPASFNNYDVFALNDGTWTNIATGMSTNNGNMPVAHPVVATTAAIQFLQIGEPPPSMILIVR